MAFGKRNNSLKTVNDVYKQDLEDHGYDPMLSQKQRHIAVLVLRVCFWVGLFVLIPLFLMIATKSFHLSNYKHAIAFNKVMPKSEKLLADEYYLTDACAPTASGRRGSNFNLVISWDRFEKTSSYLACTMRVSKERLCDSKHRKKLVRQLKTFIEGQEKWVLTQRSARKLVRVMSKRRLANSKSELERKMFVDWNKNPRPIETPPEDLPATIGNAFFDLMSEGYLSRSDFEWFGYGFPEKLEPYVPSSINEKGSCDG